MPEQNKNKTAGIANGDMLFIVLVLLLLYG